MGEPTPRVHLAWLMWCYAEGYRTAEDRAIMENWFGEHQDNAEDEATRQSLLTMADEVLAALAVPALPLTDEEWRPFAEAIGIDPDAGEHV